MDLTNCTPDEGAALAGSIKSPSFDGYALTPLIPLRAAVVPKAVSLVNVRLDILIPLSLPIDFILVAIISPLSPSILPP
jgi:hypothetical protein